MQTLTAHSNIFPNSFVSGRDLIAQAYCCTLGLAYTLLNTCKTDWKAFSAFNRMCPPKSVCLPCHVLCVLSFATKKPLQVVTRGIAPFKHAKELMANQLHCGCCPWCPFRMHWLFR